MKPKRCEHCRWWKEYWPPNEGECMYPVPTWLITWSKLHKKSVVLASDGERCRCFAKITKKRKGKA